MSTILGSSSIDDNDDDDDDDDEEEEEEEEDTTAAATLPVVSPLSFVGSLTPTVSCSSSSSSIPVSSLSPSLAPSLLLKLLLLSEYHLAIEGFLPVVRTSHHMTSHDYHTTTYDTSNDSWIYQSHRILYNKIYCNSPGMMIQ